VDFDHSFPAMLISSESKRTKTMMLLQTKLHRPRLTTGLIRRPQLLERLHKGLERKLTVVSAPPGYGKTTLINQWLTDLEAHSVQALQIDHRIAWLSLDEHDNELVVFLGYFVAAVQTVFPDACSRTQSLLQAPELPALGYLSTALINELAAIRVDFPSSSDGPRFIIVLDDYHLIHQQDIHQLVSQLLEYQPPQLHLVLASRTDPARLPLVQLRARNELTEIRTRDLRFSLSETKAFLAEAQGVSLADESVAAINEKVEGWVVGLRLALLSTREMAHTDSFLQALKGTDRYVMAYLLDEVLSCQSKAIHDSLLQTSILDRFCGSLCEAVSGIDDPVCNGQAFLDWLERSGLFVVSLDNEGQWYRYHHLFRDLLAHKLETEFSRSDIAALHRQAGRWLADSGLLEEALNHALAADDVEMVIAIFESRRNELLDREHWPLLIHLLNRLPQVMIIQHPSLLLFKAWITRALADYSAVAGWIDQAETLLNDGIGQLDEAEETVLRGEIDCLRGELAFFSGQFETALSLCQRAHDHLQPETFPHTLSRDFVAYCLQATGHVDLGRQFLGDFREARSDHKAVHARDVWVALLVTNLFSGEWVEVERTARHMLALYGDQQKAGWSSMAHYALGVVAYEWNDLENALSSFNIVTSAFHHAFVFQDSHFGQVACHCALGQLAEAQQAFDQLLAYIGTSRSAHLLSRMEAAKARLALCSGETQTAIRWANSTKLEALGAVMFWSEVPYMTQARAFIVQGTVHSLAKAQENLQAVLKAAEKSHNLRRMIDALAGQALAYAAQGDQAQALAKLDRAVTLAWPHGYMRTFVDYGPALAELLLKLRAEDNTLKSYIQQLLTAFGQTVPAGPTSISQPLIEPLTDRELEILALLTERQTYKEIAQTLTISPRTVKTHVNNIYQKLGVNRRQQATDKARSLGLLPAFGNPLSP